MKEKQFKHLKLDNVLEKVRVCEICFVVYRKFDNDRDLKFGNEKMSDEEILKKVEYVKN